MRSVMAVLIGFQALRRASNFAISKPGREMLFTVVSPEQKYKSKYTQLSEGIVGSTTSTTSMQNVVKVVDLIQKRYLSDPEELLSLVSRDISIFPDIRVKKIQWFTSKFAESGTIKEASWGRQTNRKKKKTTNKNKRANPKGFFEIAVVEARLLSFDGDYRYALSVVDDLEKALNESGNYYLVEIIKRPLDIEPGKTLSGDFSASRRFTEKPVATLAFRVVREVTYDE